MWLHAGNETTPRHFPVYLYYERTNCKARLRGIKCVSLLDRTFHSFSRAKLSQLIYRACILLWKTIFLRNLSCQSSYFWWKLVGLIFLQFPGWKWKVCSNQRRLTFSSCSSAPRFHTYSYAAWFCARNYACLCCNVSLLAG